MGSFLDYWEMEIMRVRRSTRMLAVLAAFGASALLAACASSGGGASSPRRSGNFIGAEEFAQHSTVSARDALQRLRPRWLRARGGGTPAVILDGARQDASILDSIRASNIESMELLNASDATTRYGTNFPNGAIIVMTKSD